MFGKLKEWRRVSTRYDRCLKVFLPAIALAATVIFRLRVLTLVTPEEWVALVVKNKSGQVFSWRRARCETHIQVI